MEDLPHVMFLCAPQYPLPGGYHITAGSEDNFKTWNFSAMKQKPVTVLLLNESCLNGPHWDSLTSNLAALLKFHSKLSLQKEDLTGWENSDSWWKIRHLDWNPIQGPFQPTIACPRLQEKERLTLTRCHGKTPQTQYFLIANSPPAMQQLSPAPMPVMRTLGHGKSAQVYKPCWNTIQIRLKSTVVQKETKPLLNSYWVSTPNKMANMHWEAEVNPCTFH